MSAVTYTTAKNIVVWGAQQLLTNVVDCFGIDKIDYIYPDGQVYAKFQNIPILSSVEQIAKLEDPFVLVAKAEGDPKVFRKIAEQLEQYQINFDHILLHIAGAVFHISTLIGLDRGEYTDINGNIIRLAKNIVGDAEIRFVGKQNLLSIGTAVVLSGKNSITFYGGNNICDIKRWCKFENLDLALGYSSKFQTGEHCYLGNRFRIECSKYKTFEIGTFKNIGKSHNVILGNHVLVEDGVGVVGDTVIGDGSIVRSHSVLKGKYGKRCEIAGNIAEEISDNVTWTSDLQEENTDIFDVYNMRDRHFMNILPGIATVDICGCCVSRVIVNKSIKVKAGNYILQNPIQTMYADAIDISLEQIRPWLDSEFRRRCTYYDINKLTWAKFQESKPKADFFMFDVGDIRFEYLQLDAYPKVRIVANVTAINTLNYLIQHGRGDLRYHKVTFNKIDKKEWYRLLDKFIADIYALWDPARVIFVTVPTAHHYYKNNEIKSFSQNILEIEVEPLLKELERYVKKNLSPQSMVFDYTEEVFADVNAEFGIMPYHYRREDNIKLGKAFDRMLEKFLYCS